MASFFIFMREMINKIYDNCNLETVMKTLMKISKERFIIIEISKIPFNRPCQCCQFCQFLLDPIIIFSNE